MKSFFMRRSSCNVCCRKVKRRGTKMKTLFIILFSALVAFGQQESNESDSISTVNK